MLELTDICKAFEKNTVNEKVALDQVSLSLNSGEFVTLVGSNGAGKSTLLNAVAGVYLPDCGRIMLDEREITHLSEHQRAAWIGRVFQNPLTGTAPLMTVEENLVMAWRRGQRRRLRKAIRFQERSFFPGTAGHTWIRTRRSPYHQGRTSLRRAAPGLDPPDGHPKKAAAAPA
jgi:putative ABC transport system ATP-binding protein